MKGTVCGPDILGDTLSIDRLMEPGALIGDDRRNSSEVGDAFVIVAVPLTLSTRMLVLVPGATSRLKVTSIL